MNKFLDWLLHPPVSAPKATVLIRWMAGGVFVWEGILKFVYTNQGLGRFTKIGIPFPHFSAPAIAVFEIAGGLLLLAGLGTRLVSITFVVEMLVVMEETEFAFFLGYSLWSQHY